jgi:hypothetical protein
MDIADDCELEEAVLRAIQSKLERKKKIEKNGQIIEDLWGNLKSSNICVIRISGREEK